MSEEELPPVPFVACVSHGGPYDNHAFVAGWYAAVCTLALANNKPSNVSGRPFPTPLVRQLDLIAMRYGYTMTTQTWDDTWTFVTFHRSEAP